MKFLDWFGNQPNKYKVLVAGNHDLFLEEIGKDKVKELYSQVVELSQQKKGLDDVFAIGSDTSKALTDFVKKRLKTKFKGKEIEYLSGINKKLSELENKVIVPKKKEIIPNNVPKKKIKKYTYKDTTKKGR